MNKFLIMCVALYVINKVAYWLEARKQEQLPDPYDTPNTNTERK